MIPHAHPFACISISITITHFFLSFRRGRNYLSHPSSVPSIQFLFLFLLFYLFLQKPIWVLNLLIASEFLFAQRRRRRRRGRYYSVSSKLCTWVGLLFYLNLTNTHTLYLSLSLFLHLGSYMLYA